MVGKTVQDLESYYLDVSEQGDIENIVFVPAYLDTAARRIAIAAAAITDQHKQFIYDNMYVATPTADKYMNDPTIPKDQLSTAEFIQYAIDSGESIDKIPFTEENTVQEAIQIVGSIGFKFIRIIANNI